MKLRVLLFCLLSVVVISCSKNESDWDLMGADDWKMNDKFSASEMQLFDSIDFNQTAIFKHVDNSYIRMQPYIYTSMIQAKISCTFDYKDGNGDEILNFAVVDNSLKKISTAKVVEGNRLLFNFSGYKSGTYRIYYVVQDSLKRVIFKGHGDFLIEDDVLYIALPSSYPPT